MNKWVVRALTLTILVSLQTKAGADPFERKPLEAGLAQVRSTAELPDLIDVPFLRVVETEQRVPVDLRNNFNRIQQHIFGRPSLIELRACDGCGFTAQPSSMSVFIDLDYVESIRRIFRGRAERVITYMLAHELSHFLLEYLIQLSPRKLSPSGFPSHYGDQLKFEAEVAALPTPEARDEFVRQFIRKVTYAHAEIELLALISLQQMGVNAREDALIALRHNLKADLEPQTRFDLETRIKAITEFK